MQHDFSKPVEQVINNAQRAAFDAGDFETKPEHLMYAIAAHQNNAAISMLRRMKLTISSIIETLGEYLHIKPQKGASEKNEVPLNTQCVSILERAVNSARDTGAKYVSTEHVLISMLAEKDQPEIFKRLGIVGQHEENPLVVEIGSAEKQITLVS